MESWSRRRHIHWPVSHPPIAMVPARKMTTRMRPATNAAGEAAASAPPRIIAVIAAAGTKAPSTGSRRSASTCRQPWAAYAATSASQTAAARAKIASDTAAGVPSTGCAACHACPSPANPSAILNRLGGTLGLRSLPWPAASRAAARGVGIGISRRSGQSGQVSGAGAGEGEGDDDLVVQVLADPVGQRRLLEGQVVVDGVVGDRRGLVI